MNRTATAIASRALAGPLLPPRTESGTVLRRLEVARDASWFVAGGRRVDLSKRRVLQSVLLALCDQYRNAPGVGLSSDELVERIWCGERMIREAGLNRLYVALSTLRSLGLSRYVHKRGGGYLIDPSVILRRV
jgi:hypothetical protein